MSVSWITNGVGVLMTTKTESRHLPIPKDMYGQPAKYVRVTVRGQAQIAFGRIEGNKEPAVEHDTGMLLVHGQTWIQGVDGFTHFAAKSFANTQIADVSVTPVAPYEEPYPNPGVQPGDKPGGVKYVTR